MQGHIQIDGDYSHFAALVHAGTPLFFGVRAEDGVLVSSALEARIVPRAAADEPVSPLREPSRWSAPAPVVCATEYTVVDKPTPVVAYGADATVLSYAFASDGRFVYVLRSIGDSGGARAVYVDRFVLSVADGSLNREHVVRSRAGSFDYMDEQGNPFFAPATRLDVPTDGPSGTFAVALIPTSLPDTYRWQFVARDGARILLTSIAHAARTGPTQRSLAACSSPTSGDPPPSVAVSGRVDTTLQLAEGAPATEVSVSTYARHRYWGAATAGAEDETPTAKSDMHAVVSFGLSDSTVAVLDFEIGTDGLLATATAPLALGAIGDAQWSAPAGTSDARGLALVASRLAFVSTREAPFVLDGADGFVHLYFTALDGSVLVACFDSAQSVWRQSKPLRWVEGAPWLRPGVGRAFADMELLELDPWDAERGQASYRVLLENGLYEGRDELGVLRGALAGKEIVATRPLYGVLPSTEGGPARRVDACYLGDGRILFWGLPEEPAAPTMRGIPAPAPDDRIPWAIWSFDPEKDAQPRPAFCGKCLAWGADLGASFAVPPRQLTRFEVAPLRGTRLLWVATCGGSTPTADGRQAWCVVDYDPSKSGSCDSFPGERIGEGVTSHDLLGQPPGAPLRPRRDRVVSLGEDRLLFYSGRNSDLAWASFGYDPAASIDRGAPNVDPVLPGALVAEATQSTGVFGPWPSDGDMSHGSICSLGGNRLLFYRPGSSGWATWAFDPEAKGLLDAPSGLPSPSFPGHWVGGSNSRENGNGRVVCLGPSRCLGSPVAIEFGSFAELTGSADSGAPRGPAGAMYRMYLRRTRGTQVTASLLRVGDLSAQVVGEADILPTLVGYIEGAPPVPLENLDVNEVGMSGWPPNLFDAKVDYTVSKDMTIRWSSSREIGTEARLKASSTGFVGVGIASAEATNELTVETSYGFLANNQVGTSQSLVIDRTQEIAGYTTTVSADALGSSSTAGSDAPQKEWRPYNFGSAIVTSARATVYALSLKNAKRPINYQMIPNLESVSEKLYSFKINPRYVCQGTLDGMVGTVPHPSYPDAALGQIGRSYYKKDEADALVEEIGRRGKQAEAYYSQYGADAFAKLPDLDKQALIERSLYSAYEWGSSGAAAKGTSRTSVTSEASLGGSFQLKVQLENTESVTLGTEEAGVGAKVTGKLSFLLGGSLNVTLTKASSSEEAAALTTTLRIDGTQRPGRVSGYSFQTFLLEPDTKNFWDFFNKVVDWAWLQGTLAEGEQDDPVARGALLELVNRPSAAWRILHRVTDVRRFTGATEGT